MKISLVNSQVLDGNNVIPPLGLMYIAAVLEKAGHKVQLMDADPEYSESIVSEIVSFDPDLIGFAFLTPGYQKALMLNRKLKQVLPDRIFCSGGFHTTVKPEETLRELALDFVVLGEGEVTMVEACRRLEQGEGLEGLKGIMYREGDKIVDNGRRELVADLDALPFPARHLIDMAPYLKPPGIIRGVAEKNQTTIVTSRGCPFSCIYCGSHNVFGRRTRRRSVKSVVNEMEHLYRAYHVRGVYFCDDSFTLSPKWVRGFCRELSERNLDMKWACHSRVDQTDKELLGHMKRAGLVQLDFGVESGSEKILKVLGKGGAGDRIDQIKESFRLCRELELRTLATFIIGNPEETKEDIDKSFTLAKDIDADYTAFYFLTPYPGTAIYDTAIEKGWLDKDLQYSEEWSHRQPEYPLMSAALGRKELCRIRRKLQNYFFVKNYFSNSGNVSFYGILLYTILRKPGVLVRSIAKFVKTWRLDYFAEILNREYWLLKKYDMSRKNFRYGGVSLNKKGSVCR